MTEICNSLDITYLYAILAKILSLSENYETTMPVISLESYIMVNLIINIQVHVSHKKNTILKYSQKTDYLQKRTTYFTSLFLPLGLHIVKYDHITVE